MEPNGVSCDVLLERPWLPVSINGCRLLAKSWFGETSCSILLTDLHCVWEETMHSAAIQKRAQELNKRLQAPVKAFFAHLCEVIQPCLSGSGQPREGDAHVSLTRLDSADMVLRLKSKLAGLPFYWEFRCTPAPIAVVCLHLVRPLLSMSHVLHQQVEQLEGLLVRKDAEIQDYKENGATLSRARLQTDHFEPHTYRGRFLAKTLPVVCSDLHGLQNFSGNLQELYAAVAAHGDARKRKMSDQDPDPTPSTGAEAGVTAVAEAGEEDGDQKQTSQVEEPRDKMVDTPAVQQLVSCCRAERGSSKAKKKKGLGLFR
ncbi:non-homologous end-joining factor 1 [Entelurus aequoreus]|uniref:non-homologous end-joining factor 1 n=1 Tax=Entelurus aequoreus TaxID=161455 RepID=UPI002B1D3368|nr:non-homologous end-joining factor 1 [Entelurus aequoreus]XP_061898497.1 non-homologous end-joining factor 1 [Entelurus aequoreus]